MTEFARYGRQIVLREVGVNGQQLLRDSSALIIGMGGLGNAAGAYLAGAGVGRLTLCDFDRVDLSNLQRQVLYRESDYGRPKIEAAADALKAINPHIEIDTLAGPLGDTALLAAARAADVVLDCSDNFPTRFQINAACVAARRPLVSGAAIRFEGQWALFEIHRGGACYACLYPQEGAIGETCEEAGVLGPLVGTIGSLQALAALKLLLGLDTDAGSLHLFDALATRWRRVALTRDPHCPVCSGAPE